MDPPRPAPHPHPASVEEKALRTACDENRTRGSGPGGQHRNRVATKVVLRHRDTGLEVHAGERRSQGENRKVALRRMRLALAVALRRPPAPPSPLWRSRVLRGRVSCNPKSGDYPALLAEALDALASTGWDPRPAAAGLGTTATQLLRLVADHPPARLLLDEERKALGLRRLKP